MIRKILYTAATVYLLSAASAMAQLDVQVNLGAPVVGIGPAYVSPYPDYYDPRHRNHDFRYWQQRRAQERHEQFDRNHR